MLTIFSTAKAFRGHFGVIQRNALRSWTLLHPEVEVILFGDDFGAAEACHDLGLRHEPYVERSRGGGIRADYMFWRATEISRHNILCYSNCDIVLMGDFVAALKRSVAFGKPFLMIGRRWNTTVLEPIDYFSSDWEHKLACRAKGTGTQAGFTAIDYFAFSRGAYSDMPALVVGRFWWDHWMLSNAITQRLAVIDASECVCAVHQDHDYSHLPQGERAVIGDEDARRNLELAGGHTRLRTIEDSTHVFTGAEIRWNRRRGISSLKRCWRLVRVFTEECILTPLHTTIWPPVRRNVWHPLMNFTRPLRHAIGLKSRGTERA